MHSFARTAAVGSAFFLAAMAGAQPVTAPPRPAPAPSRTQAPKAPTATLAARTKALEPLVVKVRQTLDQAAAGGDLAAATATIGSLWDWTCVNVPADQPEVFLEVGAAQRVMTFVQKYAGDKAVILRLLRASPRLTDALVYQIAPGEGDDPGAVLAVLAGLAEKFPPAQLEEMASLTAALCVVYDKPVIKFVNENAAKGVKPEDAFRFYTFFEKRMVFSPRTMPAELLVYMVDPGAQLDELAWALDGYGGQREIGPRYAEIKYDNDHFERGKEKKVSAEGFTLQNIKRYGGICADQAHFASTVGKAVGVPAVVDAGQGQGVAHAWLGFLKVTTRGAEWNFDAGRYAEYEGVRGSVTDPQTDAPIPDGTLALTAETLNVAERVRWASTAMVDGARRLAKLAGAPVTAGLELPVTGLTRTSAPADRLALLKSSLTLFSANPRAWNALRAMAADKELTLDQKKEWAGALQTMCGDRYPDFTLAILAPMVETIDDTGQQGAVWEALFRRWRGPRPDLAAEVLIEQGNMWDKAGDPARAYYSYTAAAYQFLTKSPSAVEALDLCEALLKKRNAGHQVLPMYAQAWKRLTKPDNAAQEFLMQSNWYRVGSRYCDLLEEDGQVNKADQVRKSLGEDDRSIARREKQRAPNR